MLSDFDWLSVYDCTTCGATDCTTSVEYDRFGYPTCGRCGARTTRR
jgi:translation initiation factor 2 beta subunit (eIF-2beta)/eIF-5